MRVSSMKAILFDKFAPNFVSIANVLTFQDQKIPNQKHCMKKLVSKQINFVKSYTVCV